MWEISERRRHSTLWVSHDTETRRPAYCVTGNLERDGRSLPYQPCRNANQCQTSKRMAFAEHAEDQREERKYAKQCADFNA